MRIIATLKQGVVIQRDVLYVYVIEVTLVMV